MSEPSASVVGAYVAKTHFSELLERVAAGEEITITRHGSPIARLVPVRETPTVDRRRHAIDAMRELARRNQLGDLRVKDLVAEGRK